MSVNGDTAIVGAYLKDGAAGADQGQAYVYLRSGTTWTEQAILTASDGADGDNFGLSVGLSGDTAIVSSWKKTVGGNANQGQAYVYVRSGTMWTEQAILTASDGAANDTYGRGMALEGDTAIVGALGAGRGKAYVYIRSGTT